MMGYLVSCWCDSVSKTDKVALVWEDVGGTVTVKQGLDLVR